MKFGLKIWSINHESFEKLVKFYESGIIDYVELYTFPDTFDATALSPLLILPVIFHAPTFLHGMNLCEHFDAIDKLIGGIRQYRDYFKQDRIIFHPGVSTGMIDKNIENTICNLNRLKKEFQIILENVPAIGIDNTSILIGASPDEFEKIIKETKIKTCLDFGHAIASANYYGVNSFEYIDLFLKMTPLMFHLSDGDFNSSIDAHLSFGQGSFPLEKIVAAIPETAWLTLETSKTDFKGLSEDLANLEIVKQLIAGRREN